MTEPEKIVRCSFCYEPEGKVERLYAGSSANICAECVDFIHQLLVDWREQKDEKTFKHPKA